MFRSCGGVVYVRAGMNIQYSNTVQQVYIYVISVCLSVCLPVCLPVSVCLSVCLCRSVCLSVCLPAWLAGWLAVCLSVCLPCLPACLPARLPVCMYVWTYACMRVCMGVAWGQGLQKLCERISPLTHGARTVLTALRSRMPVLQTLPELSRKNAPEPTASSLFQCPMTCKRRLLDNKNNKEDANKKDVYTICIYYIYKQTNIHMQI